MVAIAATQPPADRSAENHRRDDERQMEGQDGTAAVALVRTDPSRPKAIQNRSPDTRSSAAIRARPPVAMPGPRGNVSVAQASAATPATIVAATKVCQDW